MPKISIVIPCFNVEKYLREALNSVRFQTLDDFEAICVDDGSTDDTGSVLDEWAKNDPRFKVIHQANGGVAAARNAAIKEAIGEFIAFLDPDDLFFDPNTLNTLYTAATENNAEIAGGGVMRFTNNGNPVKNGITKFKKTEYIPFEDYQFDYGFYRFIFRRTLLINNDIVFPGLTWYEDPLFLAKALHAAGGFVSVPEITYKYRKEYKETDWTANEFRKATDLLTGLHSQLKFARRNGLRALEETLYSRRHSDFRKMLTECAELHEPLKDALNALDNDFKNQPKTEGNENPMVSIIIPSLNSAKYYRECLSSTVSQTMKDIEIICVDAGSTDETLDILQEFSSRDDRIRIIHSGKKSYGHQLNLGIDAAKGEYFAIVESDDYIDINMIKRLYAAAVENKADFVKSNLIKFTRGHGGQSNTIAPLSKNPEIYGTILNPSEDPSLMGILMNNCTGIYNLDFIRKNDIRHNETPGASFQDNGFWFRVFVTATRAFFVDEAFYYARRDNPNSSVKSTSKVYCMNVEYADIEKWLNTRSQEVQSRFMSRFIYEKFEAYNFTFSRIGDAYKFEYAMCMFGVFKVADNANLVDRSLFDQWSLSCLNDLLRDPVGFAFRTQNREGRNKLASLLTRISGNFMSPLKAPVKGKLFSRMKQCYKDNGFAYTVKRILFGKQN